MPRRGAACARMVTYVTADGNASGVTGALSNHRPSTSVNLEATYNIFCSPA